MGYIAPIPQHQYKQYQEREIKVEKHPFKFFPVQPIKPLKNKPDTNDEEMHENHLRYSVNTTNSTNLQKPSVPPEILAKVTGKGSYFNEYV
ncbi:hypothetical protein [Rossellomorea aquimaris]|uniref:hypothetical protein n=1 Tax=Rossellomorea aquimaris TaxID=189382 RepID=UPI0007D05A75|nr:hypothetical protein [Rossellomorea aquimaris]